MATGSLLALDGSLGHVVIQGNSIEEDRFGQQQWYNRNGCLATSYGTGKKELCYANTR
jgi:hypothetical protein